MEQTTLDVDEIKDTRDYIEMGQSGAKLNFTKLPPKCLFDGLVVKKIVSFNLMTSYTFYEIFNLESTLSHP